MWLCEVNSDCGLKTRGVPETDASHDIAKKQMEHGDLDQALKTVKL